MLVRSFNDSIHCFYFVWANIEYCHIYLVLFWEFCLISREAYFSYNLLSKQYRLLVVVYVQCSRIFQQVVKISNHFQLHQKVNMKWKFFNKIQKMHRSEIEVCCFCYINRTRDYIWGKLLLHLVVSANDSFFNEKFHK